MKTTYLTSLTARFNPFSTTAKVPRLVLGMLSPSAHKSVKITTTQLPRSSTQPALLEMGFKDGKSMKFSWTEEATQPSDKKAEAIKLQDIVEQVNRHARILARQEELNS